MFRTCSKNDTYDTETGGLLILQAKSDPRFWTRAVGKSVNR